MMPFLFQAALLIAMKSDNMNMLDKIRDWLDIAMYIISIIAGFYVSIWLMLIEPVIYACQCFDAGTLTATIVGITIIKILLSGFVGVFIMLIGFAIAFFISNR